MQEGLAVYLIVVAIFVVNYRAIRKKTKKTSASNAPQSPVFPQREAGAPNAGRTARSGDVEFSEEDFSDPYRTDAYQTVSPKPNKGSVKPFAQSKVTAQDLRNAVIMSEILGKPVSMRDSE